MTKPAEWRVLFDILLKTLSFCDKIPHVKKGLNMAMIYCRECGAKHSDKAKACPKCGCQMFDASKSMVVYILLAFFLGGWGVHKFYAGRQNEGIAMLLMGTIGWLRIIPGIIVWIWAVVDFIVGIINMNHPEKIFRK